MTKSGHLVTDGARVGDIILRPTLRDGYIKANGATVKASEYPRLLAWVQEAGMIVTAEQYKTDCSKYVYDATQDRLTLPSATGRVLMGGESVKSVEAGLPNITGNEWTDGAGRIGMPNNERRSSLYYSAADGESNMSFYGSPAATYGTLRFDASISNPIYGRSTTVQPPALTMIAQIKY